MISLFPFLSCSYKFSNIYHVSLKVKKRGLGLSWPTILLKPKCKIYILSSPYEFFFIPFLFLYSFQFSYSKKSGPLALGITLKWSGSIVLYVFSPPSLNKLHFTSLSVSFLFLRSLFYRFWTFSLTEWPFNSFQLNSCYVYWQLGLWLR